MVFSKEELVFVKESISKGIRTDLRSPLEGRKIQIQIIDNPQADGTICVTRGHTEVKVSIQFKESEDTLLELKLIKQKEGLEDFEASLIPISIKKQIENWLQDFKIGLRVDFEIVNDDGNIYETVIYGLRELLREVDLPVISDLDKTIRNGLVLQEMKVVCLFGPILVVDPLKVEEACCDSSFIIVGERGRFTNIWMNKCGEIDLEEIGNVLKA